MNKAGLTNYVAEASNLTKKNAKIAINAVLDGIVDGLQREGKVTLVKFGTFELYERKARKGHNPKTQEALDIPAKTALKFRVSKVLKDAAAEVDLDVVAENVEAADAEAAEAKAKRAAAKAAKSAKADKEVVEDEDDYEDE